MSYYNEVRKANQFIDNLLLEVKDGKTIDINKLLLEASKMYSVGEKIFLKRIELNQEIDGKIKISDNKLYYDEDD